MKRTLFLVRGILIIGASAVYSQLGGRVMYVAPETPN
jgi:hypothetical protein